MRCERQELRVLWINTIAFTQTRKTVKEARLKTTHTHKATDCGDKD
jgi:hypothetical protein